jgi:fructose-bisphosphate aldolase class I
MSTSRDLPSTAQALVAAGKGILAADESTGTIGKRFASIRVASTEENRRAYRELLITTPSLSQFISGIILYDETLRQKASDGRPFVEILEEIGIIAGIKVDQGAKPLAGFPGDKITEGLDGLRERLAEYAKLGACFTKWRAVISVGASIPSHAALSANAHALARFAALSQEAGLVPIVEPEVLMDGDHPIDRHAEVTLEIQRLVFAALAEHRVELEAMLLKPNMILPGTTSGQKESVENVAQTTLHCLRQTVPAAVPGIVFLSGGQSDLLATEHLNALNQLRPPAPWQLSFSYGRALQAAALAAWGGEPSHVEAAQRALLHRARCNAAARNGQYTKELERAFH